MWFSHRCHLLLFFIELSFYQCTLHFSFSIFSSSTDSGIKWVQTFFYEQKVLFADSVTSNLAVAKPNCCLYHGKTTAWRSLWSSWSKVDEIWHTVFVECSLLYFVSSFLFFMSPTHNKVSRVWVGRVPGDSECECVCVDNIAPTICYWVFIPTLILTNFLFD